MLTNIRHDRHSNLISVSQLTRQGYRIVFSHHSARVFKVDKLLLRAECRLALYTYRVSIPEPAVPKLSRTYRLSLLKPKTTLSKVEQPKKPESQLNKVRLYSLYYRDYIPEKN